jgi:hypothetical protein
MIEFGPLSPAHSMGDVRTKIGGEGWGEGTRKNAVGTNASSPTECGPKSSAPHPIPLPESKSHKSSISFVGERGPNLVTLVGAGGGSESENDEVWQ